MLHCVVLLPLCCIMWLCCHYAVLCDYVAIMLYYVVMLPLPVCCITWLCSSEDPRLVRFPRGQPASAPVSPCHQMLQTVSHERQGSDSSFSSSYSSQKTPKKTLATGEQQRLDLSGKYRLSRRKELGF